MPPAYRLDRARRPSERPPPNPTSRGGLPVPCRSSRARDVRGARASSARKSPGDAGGAYKNRKGPVRCRRRGNGGGRGGCFGGGDRRWRRVYRSARARRRRWARAGPGLPNSRTLSWTPPPSSRTPSRAPSRTPVRVRKSGLSIPGEQQTVTHRQQQCAHRIVLHTDRQSDRPLDSQPGNGKHKVRTRLKKNVKKLIKNVKKNAPDSALSPALHACIHAAYIIYK